MARYGSTAVPDLPAKPIIDILLGITSFTEAGKVLIPLMNGRDWEYWWYDGHMVFIKRNGSTGRREYHIHAAPRDHHVWRGLAFRDYLRDNSNAKRRYTELKHRLAGAYTDDREGYTRAKGEFVREMTDRALGVIGS